MGSFSSEQLTTNFYLWEERGRGWQLWDFPVELEPPFEPFFHSFRREYAIDDGRKPTFLSSLADSFRRGFLKSPKVEGNPALIEPPTEILPRPFEAECEIKELAIALPSPLAVTPDYAAQLLLNLGSSAWPLGFEIVGTGDAIIVQLACREPDVVHVGEQLRAHFPEIAPKEGVRLRGLLERKFEESIVIDCGLDQEFMRPLRSIRSFDPDPLVGVYGVLESLTSEELGIVQILFQAARNPWASSIRRSVRDSYGDPFFADAPEMLPLAEAKISRPFFAVVVRVVAQGATLKRTEDIARALLGGLTTLAQPESNELIPLSNDEYDDAAHLTDVIERRTRRSGMLLNSEELAGFVHLPPTSVRVQKLHREIHRTNAAPKSAIGHTLVLGENVHRGISTLVSLGPEQRLRHVHIIGATGTGKSTLLLNMITQDMEHGEGIAVLDPHGDLIDRILERVPENRIEDVVLLDPSDTERPVGFNILEAHSDIERTVLSSDLVDLFRRFSTSWGDQMTTVFSNAVAAIVENEGKGTLVELKRFLLEREFRDHVLRRSVDPAIAYFWEKEFPSLRGGSQISITTRLDAFLRSKIIRNVIARPGGLDFGEVVEGKNIFLARLAQGIIGEENSHVLGSLICSKLHQVIMGRQSIQVGERKPFFCYLDEFQHFATPSMASILSGSRKYAFGLILTHQDLHQIADPALASSVITNPATRICFALGDNDAQKLRSGFSHFDAADLMNLGVGEAIVRIERSGDDFNLATCDVASVAHEVASARRDRAIAHSRERYGKPIRPVESPTPQGNTAEAPATPVKTKPTPYIPIERKVAEVQPQRGQTPPTREVLIPPDNRANRKSLSQHRYLQTLIKKMAEQRGYRAVIEAPTPDGGGRVDVGLEGDGKRIACEISVTTGDVQELHNIEKCLNAGYDPVIVCSPEKKNLEAIRKLASEKLSPAVLDKVLFFDPEEVFLFLEEQAPQKVTGEERVKGYRVRVQYRAISDVEKRKKREAMASVVASALMRLKKGT